MTDPKVSIGNDYPDSVWHRPVDEVSRDSVSKTLDLWRTRTG